MRLGHQSSVGRGRSDPRNTSVVRAGNRVIVTSPEGVVRTYVAGQPFYLLEKERLTNGKVVRYRYRGQELAAVETLDPNEKHIYASIAVAGSPKQKSCLFKTSAGEEVIYSYDIRHVSGKWKERKDKDHVKRTFSYDSPPLLTLVDRPVHSPEAISYDARFRLDSYRANDRHCQCQYRATKDEAPALIHTLSLPVGDDDALTDIYRLSYDPPVPDKQGGKTTADHIEGTRVVYHYSKSLLPEKIAFYDTDKQLVKQTLYQWNADHGLESLTWADRDGHPLCRKSYTYDAYGNPILEVLSGDLTGCGETTTCTIRRQFSDDGLHLLLREETDSGKVVTFQYLSKTDLPIAKLTKDSSSTLVRQFWEYDDCYNLIRMIVDDGCGTDREDTTGITQRRITCYVLRQEQPFLHMPEWTQESYCEAGEEHLLKRTHYTYDQWGNVCQETVYDAEGKLAYHLHRTYDACGQLLSETDALGHTTTYAYDEQGHCISCRDVRIEKQREYDARGRLRTQREIGCDGLEHITSYHYDLSDRLIEETDYLGNPTRYTYDPISNKKTSTEFPPNIASDGSIIPIITQTRYDAFGRKIAETDANGHTTTFRCNAYGSPVEIVYPNGGRECFRYTTSGKVKEHVSLSGLTTTYTYDALERVVAKTYSSAQKTIAEEKFVYRGTKLISETDKEGVITHYLYDGAGRKIGEECSGRLTRYGYDALGRRNRIIQENGENTRVTFFKLDPLDQVVEKAQTDADGTLLQHVSYAYDEAGNCTATTHDRAGGEAIERKRYDAFNRCIEHKDALGHVTSTVYDETKTNALGQRILTQAMIEPNGVIKLTSYDPQGRETKKAVLQASERTIACQKLHYDAAGNLVEHDDHVYCDGVHQKTQQVAYTYDACNRMRSMSRAVGTRDIRTTHFTYTPKGQCATKTLPSGITLTYDYDPLGYLQSLSSSDGTLALTYQYDRLGRLLSARDERVGLEIHRTLDAFGNVITETFPIGLTVSKTYDALNRPLSMAWSEKSRITYAYDAAYLRAVHFTSSNHECYSHHYNTYALDGILQSESLIGGLGQVTHVTDLKGRITDITNPYFHQHCVYDAVNNVTQVMTDSEKTDYEYDDLAQLISENTKHSAHTYLHDSRYNRILTDGVVANVNDLDELLSSGTIECTYDLNGNLASKRTLTETLQLSYDPLNRLTRVSSPHKTIELTYDPLGRRLSKHVRTAGYWSWWESCREYYLYDGDNEIGAFTSEGCAKQVRVLGLAKHKNVPNTVAIELNGKVYAPLMDCQGNICRLVNPTWGFTTECYQFDAYGKEANPATYRNPWRYASKRYDSDLNLIYFGKRYYDPQLARWLTTDPAGFVDSTNLYAFLLNNPWRYVDPDGRFVIALPLLSWGCTTGITCLLPSLTTIVTTTLITAAVWYATETTIPLLGECVAALEREWDIAMSKNKYYAEDFVGTPGDLEKDPRWTETTHPEARKRGRREFVNNETGEVIEYDKGRPGETGHKAHDHYHHTNPDSIDKHDEYLDNTGKPCPKNEENYHIYPPEGTTWDY